MVHEDLTEEIMTVASRETEFESQNESDQYSVYA